MESWKFSIGDTIEWLQDSRKGIGVVSGFSSRERYIVRVLEDNGNNTASKKHTCGGHFTEAVGWYVNGNNAKLVADDGCKTDISSDDLLRILSHE